MVANIISKGGNFLDEGYCVVMSIFQVPKIAEFVLGYFKIALYAVYGLLK